MPFNQLSDAEAERLAILAEELAESIHVVGKILRHGFDLMHPDGGPTNRDLLETELGHVEYAISLMCLKEDINIEYIMDSKSEKETRTTNYLHHN